MARKPPPTDRIKLAHANLDRDRRREALTAMMQHSSTRHLLWWLLERGNALGAAPVFSTDPLIMAHNTGIMSVGQTLMNEIVATDPSFALQLIQEAQNERRERDTELQRAGGGDDPAAAGGWYDGGDASSD